jgi:hypothetical protein
MRRAIACALGLQLERLIQRCLGTMQSVQIMLVNIDVTMIGPPNILQLLNQAGYAARAQGQYCHSSNHALSRMAARTAHIDRAGMCYTILPPGHWTIRYVDQS